MLIYEECSMLEKCFHAAFAATMLIATRGGAADATERHERHAFESLRCRRQRQYACYSHHTMHAHSHTMSIL